MKEKNRFSQLLERLMTTADLKNSALAQALQYDVSYISKWASGRVLPTEKNAEKIFREISRYVVASLNDASRSTFYMEYQVTRDKDLELAIYDNLEAEYAYVRDQSRMGNEEGGQKLAYFPELTLPQFIAKMRHPDLRRVNDLEVVAVIDILHLDHDYRLMIAEMEKRHNVVNLNYPGVHFSMVINLESMEGELDYNTMFLMNLLTNLSNMDFQLYANPQAAGKIIFTIKGAYSISGMVASGNHCLAVTTCEEQETCNAMHSRLRAFCSRETLLVRKTTMEEMLANHGYVQSIISRDLQWLLGRMTEHFVSDDLYEELAVVYENGNPGTDMEELRRIHTLTRKVMSSSRIQILIYEHSITNFAVSGEIDFYNYKMTLNTDQRLRYVCSMLDLVEQNENLDVKLIHGGLITDFHHIPPPTLFLSNSLCYMRLERKGQTNNLSILNKVTVCEMFRNCFDNIWTDEKEMGLLSDRESVQDVISHMIRSIEMLDQVERTENEPVL